MIRAATPAPTEAATPLPVAVEPPADAIDRTTAVATNVWETRLFTVQDATVTVGQIVIAFGVLLLGVFAARVIAKHIGGRVLPKMRVEAGPAHALQSILYYLMLTAVIVLALQIASVPLTIFTIFGGAIALGVGFGSQNIVNNFISGLILLIEQPVQVGHYIAVDGDQGEVMKIGARATQLAEYTGARYIVPNSKLLENTVTNWHLPEPSIRSVVSVGVAYGSPVRKVHELLTGVMKSDKHIIQTADNAVLFTEFGDSSLVFELQYWHLLKTQTRRRRQESDIRFAIDKAFAEAGIVIAFPQRDVHLDTARRPLEIRMVEAKSGAGDQAKT